MKDQFRELRQRDKQSKLNNRDMRFKANKALDQMEKDDSPKPQRAQSMAEINSEIKQLINMSDAMKTIEPLRASVNVD